LVRAASLAEAARHSRPSLPPWALM